MPPRAQAAGGAGGRGRGRRRARSPEDDPEYAALTERHAVLQRQLQIRIAEQQLRAANAAAAQLPFLYELDPPALDAFIAGLMQQLQTWSQFRKIERLLRSPERLVRDVVGALSAQNAPRSASGRVVTTFTLQARRYACATRERRWPLVRHHAAHAGASCCSRAVKLINDSQACRDKCFSLLGTQLLPWAADVANKMTRAAMAPAAAPSTADEAAAAAAAAQPEEGAAAGCWRGRRGRRRCASRGRGC